MRDESSNAWVILDRESWILERSIQAREQLGRSIQAEEQLRVLSNSLMESTVLHARNLCELFADPEGEFAGEIALSYLVPGWDWGKPKYEILNGLLSQLKDKYGRRYREAKSPFWTFNKILAHLTLKSPSEQDYTAALDAVLPVLRRILVEIRSKRP